MTDSARRHIFKRPLLGSVQFPGPGIDGLAKQVQSVLRRDPLILLYSNAERHVKAGKLAS